MSKAAVSDMPERYQPDPWIDLRVHTHTRSRGKGASIPRDALRWINAQQGDRLNVAPRSASAVTVGYKPPAFLCDFRLSDDRKHPRVKVPRSILHYLDVNAGDTLRFERVDEQQFRIHAVEDADE